MTVTSIHVSPVESLLQMGMNIQDNRNDYDKKIIAGFLYVKADSPTECALIDGTLTVTY